MARVGGFGSSSGFGAPSTNPFGSGSLGGLSQYDVGENLRDIARYEAEVKWGNGDITDEEYLAVLKEQLAAATPGTREQISAVNKIDDVTYRIGRAEAQQAGLDALIAFDQKSIAGMNPDNLRYRDIADSLSSELAQRRSRDYGKLVTAYNDGVGSTESLLAYVRKLQLSLPADAPDRDNWDQVSSDLVERVATEKDADIYQQYQDRKITPATFLSYVRGRRDGFDQDSPKYDEWNRRYEDAARNVKETEQSARDNAIFTKYNEGKISDTAYLKYLKDRVKGMDPADPQKPEWEHKVREATFSLAEDLLIFRVNQSKTPAAEKAAASKLVDFYRHYRTGLNPGSSEWRSITSKITSLAGRSYSSGGGGGGGGGSSATGQPGAATLTAGKVINANASLSTWLSALTPNPRGDKKARATAEKFLNLNYDSLQNARQRGDKTWTFFDPSRPGRTVELPVSDQALASLDTVKANYNFALAQDALAAGRPKDFAGYMTKAVNAEDHARFVQAQNVQRDTTARLDSIEKGIEYYESVGDAAGVVNLLTLGINTINSVIDDPRLDETRRDKLAMLRDKLGDNPLFPSSEVVNGQRVQTGGFVDVANSPKDETGKLVGAVMTPGVHYVIDGINARTGKAQRGWVIDTDQDGTWEQTHRTVIADVGGASVPGEVSLKTAPTNEKVRIQTQDGQKLISLPLGAQYITYMDGGGNMIRAYSLDGQTWLQATGGVIPVVELKGVYTVSESADGRVNITDAEGKTVMWSDDGTTYEPDGAWSQTAPIQWLGQDYANQRRAVWAGPSTAEVGAFGQQFRVVRANEADGSINLSAPKDTRATTVRRLSGANTRSAATSARQGRSGSERNLDVIGMTEAERRTGMTRAESLAWDSGSERAAMLRSAQQGSTPKDPNVTFEGHPLRPEDAPPVNLPKPAGASPESLKLRSTLSPSLLSATKATLPAVKKPPALLKPQLNKTGERNLDKLDTAKPKPKKKPLPKPVKARPIYKPRAE